MLNALANKDQGHPVFQEFGYIEHVNQGQFIVRTQETRYTAKKAASCLQYPDITDKVLLITDPEGECYILAVLEKNGKKNKVIFEGDTDFLCKDGKIQIIAKTGVGITTARKLDLIASEMQFVADHGKINISRLKVIATHLLSEIAKTKVLGGTFESLFDRFKQKVKRSYREVEGTDQLKANRLDYSADTLLTIRGKYSMLTAEEDVKINGERIHMG